MSSPAKKLPTPWLIVGFHLLVCAVVLSSVDYWPYALRNLIWHPIVSASLLVLAGTDLCLLGLWAALSPRGSLAKWLATGLSVICWCGIYTPDNFHWLGHWSDYGSAGAQYAFIADWVAVGGLALLAVSLLTCSLRAAERRGIRFRLLNAEEAALERSSPHFQLSHLLLLTAVLSLFLGFSLNCRQWLSYEISMRWRFAAYAPIQSAETVLVSSVLQTAGSLVLVWATLTYGRPWLRLMMALIAAGLFGFDFAFSFTAIRHGDQLVWNGLFSACVAVIQAVLVSAVLLVVRGRGYRLLKMAHAESILAEPNEFPDLSPSGKLGNRHVVD